MRITQRMAMAPVILLVISGSALIARVSSNAGQQPPVQEIIQKFSAAEALNKTAMDYYLYTRDYDLMTLGEAGSFTGRYKRVSNFGFDDLGNRVEKITFFPQPNLAGITVSQEDLDQVGGITAFPLVPSELPKYKIDYVGKERIDELNTYVFDVKPKQMVKGQKYFQGRIWVDDQDVQIVKVKGKAVKEPKTEPFTIFEEYRENVRGKYWLPSFYYSDDDLEFKKGPSIHIRMEVHYTNFKKPPAGTKTPETTKPDDGAGKQ